MPFQYPQTNVVYFNHTDIFAPSMMSGHTLNDARCLKRLFGRKIKPDLKHNSYICAIDKDAR